MTKEQKTYIEKLEKCFHTTNWSPWRNRYVGRPLSSIELHIARTDPDKKCSNCGHLYRKHSFGFDGPCGFFIGIDKLPCKKNCMSFEYEEEFESLIKKIRSKKK